MAERDCRDCMWYEGAHRSDDMPTCCWGEGAPRLCYPAYAKECVGYTLKLDNKAQDAEKPPQ